MLNINSNDDQLKTNETKTVSDIIGDAYKTWNIGNYIFINASTGTGKTSFILNTLFDYACINNYKIAMLVNRKVLKEQVENQIKDLAIRKDVELSPIKIFTYQEIENADENELLKIDYICKCRYIVCDETHYFLQDAIFNPKTQKSFNLIMDLVPKSIVIFMTATSKEIREYITKVQNSIYERKHNEWSQEEEKRKNKYEQDKDSYCSGEEYSLSKTIKRSHIIEELEEFPDELYNETGINKPQPLLEPQEVRPIEYSLFRDIRYRLNVKLFRSIDELVDTICNNENKGKWLIFVNTKKIGKQLYQDLNQKGIVNDDRIFIDANYRKHGQEKEKKEVDHLTKHQYSNYKIFICTSVLDNGINFDDIELKNLVIMADSEVEFLQMLGRKRLNEQNGSINLFLFSEPKSKYENRSTYYSDLHNKLTKYQKLSYKKVIDLLLVEEFNIDDIRNYYVEECENNPGYKRSDLSLEAIRLRYIFWADMNEKLKQDNNAFIKEQFTWLNIPFPETEEELLSYYYITYSKKDLSDIVKEIENIYEKKYGILSTKEYKKISGKLKDIASKMNFKFESISGKFAQIDAIMNHISEDNEYNFDPIQLDKGTYYELKQNNEHRIKIKVSEEEFKAIINKYDSVTDKCFEELTGSPVPDFFHVNKHLKQSFLSEIMKRNEDLKEFTIKVTNNKLILSKRAKQR